MKASTNSISCIILLLFLVPFTSGTLKNILFLLIFAFSLFTFLSHQGDRRNIVHLSDDRVDGRMIIVGYIIIAYAILNMFINGLNSDALERVFQVIVCIFLLNATSTYRWKRIDYQFIVNIIRMILIASFLVWPLRGFRTNYYPGLYGRGNAFGGFC